MVKNIEMEVVYLGQVDKDGWEANEYKVILKNDGKEVHTPYYTGLGWTREPKVEEVMDSLFSDADAKNYETFESWAQDFGYDTDSRKAEAIFNKCLEIDKQLDYLLGDDREYFEEKYREQ